MTDGAAAPPQPFALTWLLSGAYRQLKNELHARMASHGFPGMRSAHGFAFQVLAQGGATGAKLAAHLGISKQAASQLIDELEHRGWAERTPGPDKRTKTVILTEAGWAVTRAAEQAGVEIEADLIAALGATRVRRLVEDLRHLDAALGSMGSMGSISSIGSIGQEPAG